MQKQLLGLLAILLAITLTLSLPSARALASPEDDWQELFEVQLQRAYQRAVEDAYDAQPDEINHELWAITPDNPQLIWREEKGQKQVLMVTWTSWNGYSDRVGQKMDLEREIWVTAAPELQQFASQLDLSPTSLTLRLEQYLGLPPHNGKTKFVQMWVDPREIFRPCPDSEISDTRCELQFPQRVSRAHKDWLIDKMLTSYGEPGYPLTRLGYTYDWGSLETEFGASEFLIRKGAQVEIESVTETIESIDSSANRKCLL